MNSDPRIVMRPTDALRPYDKNPRTHTPEQIAKVARSIREYGWTNPILVDRDGTIVAGHARLEACVGDGPLGPGHARRRQHGDGDGCGDAGHASHRSSSWVDRPPGADEREW